MKLNDFYKNMKHTEGTCPSCKNSESVLYDEFHGETFCAKCGFILHYSARNSNVEHEGKLKRNNGKH